MTDEREPDPNLESELRQGAGRDWSAEAAEDERMTEKLRDRRMELSELMRRFVTTGQRVRAESGSQAFAGPIVFAGTDYAVVGRDDDEVAIKLVGATWTLETGGTEGHHQSASPMSFKAHLSELESSGEVVRILVEDGRSLRGPIRTVASDNLSIDCDGSVVLIPLPAVIGVSRPRPS
jgi:hypothetical protein